jgi:hypothetical protein
MMKRLLVISLMVLSLPVLAELSCGSREAVAFNVVAVAGHTTMGGECNCGPGCLPDYPGEIIDSCGAALGADDPGDGGGLLFVVFVIGVAVKLTLKL